jgi:hypothetical protein
MSKVNKTISIPTELDDVWYKIPNRSAWITRMLLEMEPLAIQEEHKAWSSGIDMCNLKHKRGVCGLCLKELNMNENEAVTEYFRRTEHYQKGWPKYWRDEE